MAALRGLLPIRIVGAAVLLATTLILVPIASALAADPSHDPAATARPPTCAERFPAEGPAGVDLRLGCIFGEVVGLYVPGQAAPPAPISSYAIISGILTGGVLIVIWLLARSISRAAGRRLAPMLPGAWWVCASCSSVNGAGVARCYACGSTPPVGPTLLTDDHPDTHQSFGSTRKRG